MLSLFRRLYRYARSSFFGILSVFIAATVIVPTSSADVLPALGPIGDTLSGTEMPADSARVYHVDGIVVTGTRSERREIDVPRTVRVLDGDLLRTRELARTLPEALNALAGVMVQKTSNGQGSPYLHGFTGFRTLMLIDGIRLNNSVFRDGPNQYWNTVDLFAIDGLEAVFGAGSLLYGTDAIGGVVNVKPPRLFRDLAGQRLESRVYYRVSGAERSQTGRLQVLGTLSPRMAMSLGLTGKTYGDVRAGGGIGRQAKTGYDEWNADGQVAYHLSDKVWLRVVHQQTNQDDVWRTHKTVYGTSWEGTTVGTDRRYVLDQFRSLSYVRCQVMDAGTFLHRLTLTGSYQRTDEDQVRQRSSGRTTESGLEVGTISLNAELEIVTGRGRLTSGIDYYRDFVDSYGRRYDSAGGLTLTQVQGPVADDAGYRMVDFFAQYELSLDRRFEVIAGGRYSNVAASAERVGLPDLSGPAPPISEDWQRVVGSARLVYIVQPASVRVFAGVAQAFRAPNLSDLTRYDAARSNEVEVPSPGLAPELFTAWEAGLKADLGMLSMRLSLYHTHITDMIVRRPTGDTLDGEAVVSKRNAGSGYVQGVELSAKLRPKSALALFSDLAWLQGEADAFPTSAPVAVREPIDRKMPLTVRCGIDWQPVNGSYWLGMVLRSAHAQDDLSSRDVADTQRIPPGGTPGYVVLNTRAGLQPTGRLTLSMELHNLFDTGYRIHGSGQNEPGRGISLAVNWQ